MIGNDVKKGVTYMVFASFCFALTGACARYLSKDINAIELVLFRNLIGVVFILYSVIRNPLVQIGGRLALLIFRGVIGTLALYTFFYGVSRIGLAVAITYQQAYPVFLAIVSYVFLHEELQKREWAAIFIGFAGICFIFIPSIDVSSVTSMSAKYHAIGLSNAIMTGMAYLSIKGLSAYYDTRSIVLSFMLSGIILPVCSLVLGSFITYSKFDFIIQNWDSPSFEHWPAILLLGVAALMGQIYLTKAFSYQRTGVIAAVGYSNIVFSIIFGTMLGDAFPDLLSLIGIAFIITCGVIVSWGKTP